MDLAARTRSELEQAQIICVIGGPGVGKGTQCAKMVKGLGVVHLSIGEVLRSRASTSQGIDITAYMQAGELVPNEMVQGVLEAEISTYVKAGRTHILLDGFPRSVAQMEMFEESHCKVKAVLYFQGSRETLVSRILNRAQTSGRVDDTEAIFDKRYQGFLSENEEVIRYFEQGQKLVKVDCDRPLEDIYEETMEMVKSIFSEEHKDGEGFRLVHDNKNPQT